MHINYLILDALSGEVVETGASRLDRAKQRVQEGQVFVIHDGSLAEYTNLPVDDFGQDDLIYGMTDLGIASVSLSEKTDTSGDVIQAARMYLEATDWYVTRMVETGTPVPEDVLAKRAEARLVISLARSGVF